MPWLFICNEGSGYRHEPIAADWCQGLCTHLGYLFDKEMIITFHYLCSPTWMTITHMLSILLKNLAATKLLEETIGCLDKLFFSM